MYRDISMYDKSIIFGGDFAYISTHSYSLPVIHGIPFLWDVGPGLESMLDQPSTGYKFVPGGFLNSVSPGCMHCELQHTLCVEIPCQKIEHGQSKVTYHRISIY